MPPLLYDVFVTGSSDSGATAEARLATTLATQSGRPVTTIARAIAERNLRVGHSVARDVAEKIAREMQQMGAAIQITPLGVPGEASRPTSGGFDAVPPSALGRGGSGFSLTPLGVQASTAPATRLGTPGPAHLDQAYEPPSLASSFAMPETPPPAPNPGAFSGPGMEVTEDLPLELATPQKKAPPKPASTFMDPDSTSTSSLGRPSYTLAGASALNTSKIVATSSASGLSLSDEEAAHTERCNKHGLLFDRRKSRGCRRCVEGRRSARVGETVTGRLRATPARRAFIGLGLALVCGFVPAALYSKTRGMAETMRLRAEQTELSQKAGTEEILRRFDALEEMVGGAQTKNLQSTLFIWIAAGGLVMAGFYRAT